MYYPQAQLQEFTGKDTDMHAANVRQSFDTVNDLWDTHVLLYLRRLLLTNWHLDDSVQSTQQAWYTHLAYLENLKLWNLLVADLSWGC